MKFSILREKSGLSVQDIAERSGRSVRTIYRWEKGETKPDKLVIKMLRDMTHTTYTTHHPQKKQFSFTK